MGTANVHAIKERIAELTAVAKPKGRTVAARSRRYHQRRKQDQNTVTTVSAAPRSGSITSFTALLSALGLACVSAFFSIVGLTSIFLGSFWPVVAMGTVFEGAKLSAVALLGQGRVTSRRLKFAIVTLIAALMALNLIGAYGFLAHAQITYAVATEIEIANHAAQVQARKTLAMAKMDDINKRIGQIDAAISEATKRGRTTSAMALAEHQTTRRDALVADGVRAATALASLEVENGGVESERAVGAAAFGPIEYLSKLLGTERDTAMRWFIVLVACLLDPAALLLLLAATASCQNARESLAIGVA